MALCISVCVDRREPRRGFEPVAPGTNANRPRTRGTRTSSSRPLTTKPAPVTSPRTHAYQCRAGATASCSPTHPAVGSSAVICRAESFSRARSPGTGANADAPVRRSVPLIVGASYRRDLGTSRRWSGPLQSFSSRPCRADGRWRSVWTTKRLAGQTPPRSELRPSRRPAPRVTAITDRT